MHKIWIFLSGQPDLTFERRQTTLVASVGAILCLLATIINTVTGQAVAMTVLCLFGTAILIALRLLMHRLPNLGAITVGLAFLGMALGILGWMTSAGVYGSAPYVFYLVLTWLLAIRKHRAHFFLIGMTVAVMALLIAVQAFLPQFIMQYPDQKAQFADLIVGALLTLVFQAFFISSLRHQFEEEQGRLREKNTQLSGMTQRLSHAKEQADAALAVRSNFIAAMSHELRTPLTSVIAGTRLLRKNDNSGEHEEIKNFIERSAESLLRVIDDILVLRAEETGEISIVCADFRIDDLVHDLLRMYAPQAEAKGFAIHVHVDEELPEVIHSDAPRITQIVSNLLSNAIKYTERGGVSLSFEAKHSENGVHALRICVTDTGTGIPAPERENLFKPFMRSSDARRHVRGTGLGLSICSMLTRRLGGEVELVSSGPDGSVFAAELPLGKQAHNLTEPLPLADTRMLAGKKILIAEDDEINALLLRHILERYQANCTVVANGRELTEKALSEKWNLIITDIQMPEMDGFQAAQKIMETLGRDKSPQILAVSASNFAEEEENISRTGIAAWISKPYDETGLLNCVMLHLA